VRKFMVLACVLGLSAVSAMAAETGSYPKAELFGGYQYSRFQGGVNANGFDFAVNGNFNNYFGVTADFGAAFNSQADPFTGGNISVRNYTYTFGPQLSLRANKAYTPFVHVLIGGDRASASESGVSLSNNGLAMLAGGGADFNFSQHMAFRGGADWMLLHSNGTSNSKNVRMLMGIVFKY
jgi:hypothetical protein